MIKKIELIAVKTLCGFYQTPVAIAEAFQTILRGFWPVFTRLEEMPESELHSTICVL
jgi:hypothetical protein